MSADISDEVGVYIVERDSDPPSQRLVLATVNREKPWKYLSRMGQNTLK